MYTNTRTSQVATYTVQRGTTKNHMLAATYAKTHTPARSPPALPYPPAHPHTLVWNNKRQHVHCLVCVNTRTSQVQGHHRYAQQGEGNVDDFICPRHLQKLG